MHTDKLYFKGLNGIRALAAMGVILSHLLPVLKLHLIPNNIIGQQGGEYGVTVFFTLSGFLITYLLLVEKDKSGDISFKKFYSRRILRIWPLYFLYIFLVLFTYKYVFHSEIANIGNLIFYFVFLANIPFQLGTFIPAMPHLWSVSIEEQFYAFWPLIILYSKKLVRNLLIFIFTIIIIRSSLAAYSISSGHRLPYSFTTSMRFDCMAIGALIAVLFYHKNKWLLSICSSFIVVIAFWAFFVLSIVYRFHFFSYFSDDVASIVTGLFIVSQVISTKKVSILENPLMTFLGKISYGLYIYHFLVIAVISWLLDTHHITINPLIVVLIDIFATILVAYLSYTFIEKAFLKLKERYAVVVSGKI